MSHKVLIFDDNPDFGGHQIMAALAIEGLIDHGNWEILGLCHPENVKNLTRWNAILEVRPGAAFRIELSPTRTQKFNGLRRYLAGATVAELKSLIDDFQPELILMIQGNIEQGSCLFNLVGQLNCPLVSYIPLPHTHSEMGAKLGGLRDWSCRSFYGLPDGYITLSETLAQMLQARGAQGRVEIVPNGIDFNRFNDLPTKKAVCAQYALPESGFIWAHIGRVEWKQKGQDISLSVFKERMRSHPDEALVFIGSGPDLDRLKAECDALDRVYHIPWLNEVASLFPAINGLLLPSRYEGVPLVMLEALANHIPVLASDRDGMRDWLPAVWRFNPEDSASIRQAMDLARAPESRSLIEQLSKRVSDECRMEQFKLNFNQKLLTWV